MKLKGNIEKDSIIYLNEECEISTEKILTEDDIVVAMIGRVCEIFSVNYLLW